jgi:nucleoside-diphosphate-sugar epimerase
LGSELLRQLHARGATGVWALTRSPDDVPAWPGLTVLGYDDVKDFGFGEVGVMIHAAFPRDAAGAEMAAGVKATNELLAAAACGGVGAVVNVSSQSVYDRARTEPADEATPLAPATDYGRAKVEQEKVVAALFPPGRFTSVRLGSLVGPGFDVRVMNKFVAQARAGQDLRVMGGGQRFSYLDIRDAAAAFLALAEQPAASWRPLYVMGHPQAVTLLEMAEAVARLAPEYTGHDVAVNVEPGGKWTSTELAPAAFMQDTGWTPQYTLEATIRTLYEAA